MFALAFSPTSSLVNPFANPDSNPAKFFQATSCGEEVWTTLCALTRPQARAGGQQHPGVMPTT